MPLVEILLKLFTILRITVAFILLLPFYSSRLETKELSKYDFKVLRVIDGDTIDIDAQFLPPELGKHLKLRVYGVDTPEKGHQAKCNEERRKAQTATEFVQSHQGRVAQVGQIWRSSIGRPDYRWKKTI